MEPNNPLIIIKNISFYLMDYSYNIEHFLEGYAINFEEKRDPEHNIILFFNSENRLFSIKSFYEKRIIAEYNLIKDVEILNQILLKLFLRLDLIEIIQKTFNL